MKKYFFMLLLMSLWACSAFAQDKIGDVKVSDDGYAVLATKRIQTMEKELDEAAAKGFRVLFGGPTQNLDVAIFLKRIENPANGLYKYKVLATSRLKTMEKEMNDAAKGGFRILPSTITFKQGFLTAELFLIMEREPTAPNNYEYKLIEAGKEVNLQKKIEEAQGQGYEPITLITLGKHVIIMERVSRIRG